MVHFDYSLDAKNVINKFHNVDKMVYVEGEDDIPFWEIVFRETADFSVEIESVGGKPELLKHISDIEAGRADYILAIDSDYDAFLDCKNHPSVIKTYGYSIENTIISFETICKTLKILLRLSAKDIPYDLCHSWINNLDQCARDLIYYDIINHIEGLGLSIIPESSDRFMKSKSSCELCDQKINEFLAGLHLAFTDDAESYKKENILNSSINILDLIKGHFLFSSLLRFLKVQARKWGKNVSISNDMLYATSISVFEGLFNTSHRHFSHYKRRIESIP